MRGKDSLSSTWHGHDEIRFNLSAVTSASSETQSTAQERTPPVVQHDETKKPRVFLTGAEGNPPKEKARDAFQDRCRQALMTVDKEKANYFVELSPASFKQPKNLVLVTNRAGDVIHSGATHNLGNAASDACSAILKDFATESR